MNVNGMDYNWKVYHFFSDCGHGWLRVPFSALYRLGIARLISSCSYRHNGNVYLEEDNDACIFIDTLKSLGIPYRFKCHNCNYLSHIRKFERYSTSGAYDNDGRYLELEKKALKSLDKGL